MTKRQAEVARFFLEHQLRTGRTPTTVEAGASFGTTGNAISCHLYSLERQGIIRRFGEGTISNEGRRIEIVWPAKNLIRPPYKVLWETVNGRLVYSPRDVLPSQLDQQKEEISVSNTE